MAEFVPEAPAIGGDSYEVADWLRACVEHFREEAVDCMLVAEEMLAAFVEMNPETAL